MKKIILLFSVTFCCVKFCHSQAGKLDSSFGKNGIVSAALGKGQTEFNSIAVQKDGKILVGGNAWNGRNFDLVLARYHADGSPDNTFGINGTKITALTSRDDYTTTVALQSDGKIIVAAKIFDTCDEFGCHYRSVIVRYTANGILDNSFSGNGVQSADFPITSIAIQSDNKIVAVGKGFTVARYNTNGSLDHSFSNDGKLITEFFSDGDKERADANSIAIQPDGKIVVGGFVYSEYGYHVVLRYNTNGSLYLKWGVFSEAASAGCFVTIQKNGDMIVAGHTYYREYNYIKVARISTDGSSIKSSDFGGFDNHDYITSVAVQDNGKVIVAGTGIFRFNARGGLDTTFSDDGIQRTTETNEFINSIVIVKDKLYTAGIGISSDGMGVITRYLLGNVEQTAPEVTIVSPSNNATYTVPAKIKINAVAADDDGTITKVAFYNGSTLLHTETAAPYDCTIDNAPVGNYSITAKATDNSGNVVTSGVVNISVVPNKAPTVKITSPANGASFTAPVNIILSADADDVDGRILKVDFYDGSTLIFSETAAPYSRKWFDVPAGNHSITAKATDNNGKTTTSAPVAISVGAASKLIASGGKLSLSDRSLGLNAHPNPVAKTLNISIEGLQTNKSAISILSVSGVTIKTIQPGTLNKNIQLDVSSLSAGIYYIKVINGDKIFYKQFLKL